MTTQTKSELIVIVKPEYGIRIQRDQAISLTGQNVTPLNNLLLEKRLSLKPLCGQSEDQLKAEASSLAAQGIKVPNLAVFYRIDAPAQHLSQLAARFNQIPGIAAAYVKAPAQAADTGYVSHTPRSKEPPVSTPDFRGRQDHLNKAPHGMGVHYAHRLPGGHGKGVKIIVISQSFGFNHEDTKENQGGVFAGENLPDYREHGTAIVGIIGGDRNAYGTIGISPAARISGISPITANGQSTARTIYTAAQRLHPGDIMLISLQRPGPRTLYGPGTYGSLPLECWPDDLAAIQYATANGIIVVAAAGNGGQNLDDVFYEQPVTGRAPSHWRNPLNPANPGSGAILVGAGNPSRNNSHGRRQQPDTGETYTDRGRCFYSNYGARVDAQGYGWEVTTTGYGDLQGGSRRNRWYTDEFSGTSAAVAMVAGAIASIQGILKAHHQPMLTPAQVIKLLRSTGSPQRDARSFTFPRGMSIPGYPQEHPPRPSSEHIGNRPHIKAMIDLLLPKSSYLFQTGTALAQTPQDWEFAMMDWDGNKHPDFFAIGKNNTGSGMVEVHVMSRISSYQRFILHQATKLHQSGQDFKFLIADWNKDGRPDLIGIKTNNTSSNSTEVHILSGSSNFQQFVLQVNTALPLAGQDYDFAMADWNGDGYLDLIAIRKRNTGTQHVEVHILSGKSSFQTYLLQRPVPLPHNANNLAFAITRWNRQDNRPSLVVTKKNQTGSGTTEVHVLSGASNFQEFILQTGTILPETDDSYDFTVMDWELNGQPDLIAIKKSGTSTGTTELHIVNLSQ